MSVKTDEIFDSVGGLIKKREITVSCYKGVNDSSTISTSSTWVNLSSSSSLSTILGHIPTQVQLNETFFDGFFYSRDINRLHGLT